MVQDQRTSSNLLKPHDFSKRKVCRALSHEFRVVRPYRTSSTYIVTEATRYEALVRGGSRPANLVEPSQTTCFQRDTVCRELSHEFRVVRPYRTSSTYSVTEATRYVALVQGGSRPSKLVEPSQTMILVSARCVSSTANLSEPPQNA